MKEGQKLWTRNELILAINLYCKLPFGRLHSRNPAIIELAELIARTSNSVAYKLVNFASLDPALKARGIKGASNTSNLDKEIWNEFYDNWDSLFIESEKLFASTKGTSIEAMYEDELSIQPTEGIEKLSLVKVRLNQAVFRRLVLANFDNRC